MKKKLYFFLMAAFLATSAAFAVDTTSGLKVHYTFDDVTTDGIVPDHSGNNLQGQFKGSAAIGQGYGTTGSAVSLTNVADYVQLPNDINSGVTDFTFAAWINLNSLQYWGRVFDIGNGADVNCFLAPTDGHMKFVLKQDATLGEQAVTAGTAVTAGKWAHVAISCHYDETTGIGTAIIYINGSKAGTNDAITGTLNGMGTTPLNYLGKSQYDDPTIDGRIDDFRFYARALSANDIMTLVGYPEELINQYEALSLGDTLASVKGNITLPLTMGSNGVTVSWATSDSAVITKTGVVTRPEYFKAAAKLTATLTYIVNKDTSSIVKTFDIFVAPLRDASETVAIWNFTDDKLGKDADGNTTVGDESDNAFVGTCKDGASVVTIGDTKQFNVLAIGTSGQYFDFGTKIGEAVYGLTDYTVSIFYRKDASDGATQFTGNGQQLYGFSNSLNLSSEAIGAMYFEPLRGRHVCTPDNYGSEGSNYVGVGEGATPLGTWHNITYTQTNNKGVLYIDGVASANATMPNPAVALKQAGRKGTLYNSIGRPFYAADPWLTNTLIYGFKMYAVGLTADDLNEVLAITNTIGDLDLAFNSTKYDVKLYVALKSLLETAKDSAKSNYTPAMADFNSAIATAQAAFDGKTPTQEGNDALTAAIKAYATAIAPWYEMASLLKTTDAYVAQNLPGLDAFKVAIAAAQAKYNEPNVTVTEINALKDAIKAYKLTEPASASKPADYTWAITNPSFEQGTGGTLDPTSYRDGSETGNGNYSYPKGWTVYLNHSGQCNSAFISDGPSDGVKCFETWAATINEFDVYQTVDLAAGYYVLSGQVRTNAAAPYTQNVYACTAKPDDKTYRSSTLVDSLVITGDGWNSLKNWQTLYCSFYAPGGKVRIGFNAKGFQQFDNMRLAYYGSDKPAQVGFTAKIANAGFEEGATTTQGAGVDTASVIGLNFAKGNYYAPIGWNAYAKLDTAKLGWCNMGSISGTMQEGTKGFEMWSDAIQAFRLDQTITAPATGHFTLTAAVRCDESAPSKVDPTNRYDAHLFAKVGNFAQKTSAMFGKGDTSYVWLDSWNSLAAWQTLTLDFDAEIGETINLGIASTSFMQIDNFILNYTPVPEGNTTVGNKKVTTPSLVIYPNPVSSILNIKGLDVLSTIRVYNAIGQKLAERVALTDNVSIDVANYAQGVYMVRIESNGKAVTSKFVKK